MPFRRIAILNIEAYSRKLAVRIETALNRGADAILLRQCGSAPTFDQALQQAGSMPAINAGVLPLLLNFNDHDSNDRPMLTHPRLSGQIGRHLKSHLHPDRINRAGYQWLGQSCHTWEEVLRATHAGVDYVCFSPVFSTSSHPEAAGVGLDVLSEICRRASIPVFALGGVTPEREEACLRSGAWGVAAVSWFSASTDPVPCTKP